MASSAVGPNAAQHQRPSLPLARATLKTKHLVAQAWLANNEAMMNSGSPLASGRVGRLVEILTDIEDEELGPAGSDV